MELTGARGLGPGAEMSSQAMEVLVEAAAGEDGQQVPGVEVAMDVMGQGAGIGDGTTAGMESQDELGVGINGSPEPDFLLGQAANTGDQLIELDMTQAQAAEEKPVVQACAVLAAARKPASNG